MTKTSRKCFSRLLKRRLITDSYSIFIAILLIINLVGAYYFTIVVRKKVLEMGITDDPASAPHRKNQKLPIPLLGATGFIITSILASATLWVANILFFKNNLNLNFGTPNLLWICLAIIILLIGGYFDDKYHLSPKWMVLPILSSLLVAVIGGGLKIEVLSYPFSDLVPNVSILHSVFAFLWIGLCLTATKFLDGLDGLVSTVGLIGFLSIASVSLLTNVNQPLVFGFSMIWAAGILGFLPFNFPNAKLYLGEGGSEIIGFCIGVLSILSGAKVATAGTVIGWFILDIILVMISRIIKGQNPFHGDRLHWHFRLIDMGLSKVKVLSITTIIIIITAHLGIIFPTEYKVYVLCSQAIVLLGIFGINILLYQKNKYTTSTRP